MPTGRAQVDYTDVRADNLTLKIDGVTIVYDRTQARGAAAAMLDKAVTLSADDTAALCADGDYVVGKLLSVEADGFCSVQRWGMATLPGGLAAALTRGKKIVGATGAAAARGYVREVNVATVAELVRAVGTIVNTADPAAVVVDLR